jgi:hypothetical protein
MGVRRGVTESKCKTWARKRCEKTDDGVAPSGRIIPYEGDKSA